MFTFCLETGSQYSPPSLPLPLCLSLSLSPPCPPSSPPPLPSQAGLSVAQGLSLGRGDTRAPARCSLAAGESRMKPSRALPTSPRRGPWPAGGEAQGCTLTPTTAPYMQESLSLCVLQIGTQTAGRKGSQCVTCQVEEATCSPAGAPGPHSRGHPVSCSQDPPWGRAGARGPGDMFAGAVGVGRGRGSPDLCHHLPQPVSLQRQVREPCVLPSAPTSLPHEHQTHRVRPLSAPSRSKVKVGMEPPGHSPHTPQLTRAYG